MEEKQKTIYQFIKDNSNKYPVKFLCELFNVSRSGYYKSISSTISVRDIENQTLSVMIKEIFTAHKGRYGCRRIKKVLYDTGINISRKRISRLLRLMNLRPKGTTRRIKYKKCDSMYPTKNI